MEVDVVNAKRAYVMKANYDNDWALGGEDPWEDNDPWDVDYFNKGKGKGDNGKGKAYRALHLGGARASLRAKGTRVKERAKERRARGKGSKGRVLSAGTWGTQPESARTPAHSRASAAFAVSGVTQLRIAALRRFTV